MVKFDLVKILPLTKMSTANEACKELTLDDIYVEYGVSLHHNLFAGSVIEKMAKNLLVAHKKGLPLPSHDTPNELTHEFETMLRIGVPASAVASQMKASGLDPKTLIKEEYNVDLVKPFLSSIKGSPTSSLRKYSSNESFKGPMSGDPRFVSLLEKRLRRSEPRKTLGSRRMSDLERLKDRMRNVRPDGGLLSDDETSWDSDTTL